MTAISIALELVDRGLAPDAAIRAGIRRIIERRLREEHEPDPARLAARIAAFAQARSEGPIAIDTGLANEQHYEVPTAFYRHVLGRHLKYSSALWNDGVTTLDDAEAAMLACAVERAALADGQRVLELGSGWGSLTLWMARAFPRSRIVAVSNSRTQKAWIDGVAAAEGLANVEVITADMNAFDAPGTFDRVVSVEMFEHMRNWQALLARIARWLTADGRLFLHIFTHRRYAYPYEVRHGSDWMAAHFFRGGIMPSDDLLYQFADLLTVEAHWRVSGTHYQRTAEAWLANLDRHRAAIDPILEAAYGRARAPMWRRRWRVFFMACAELWGWNHGQDWIVSHYRLRRAG
jgi:cyclopropane-fatty-acyl-phospholipid synthase